MIEIVKIPEQRKGVLIGKDGCVKKELEKRTHTKITIGESIEIEGEVLDVMKAKDIVRAIGRGFSPEKAFKLMDDDFRFVVISLSDKTERQRHRIFSRIIGKRGRCRRNLEMLTKTYISVYGKTISIIGNWQNVKKACDAIELLIEGKKHSYVYKYLEMD